MRRPGIIIVMAFALACTAASLAQAAVSKPANSVPLYQQMQKKRLTQNEPARRFYEALGGRSGETRVERRGEYVLDEIAYIWDDLGAFALL